MRTGDDLRFCPSAVPLNRLLTAQTQATTGQHCWGLDHDYDPWGNLLTIGAVSGYGACTQGSLSVVALNNNRLSGFSYDAAGNMTTYPGYGSYTYDAENRMISTAGVSYTYDGDGRRAKKSNGTLYWYGAGSDVLMETDLAGTLQDEYIFFNGQRIARRRASDAAVFYFFSDHLGSSRIVTDIAGAIVEDSDFYPFGGERIVLDGLNNNYKFTGQERDSESGLDYFIARHYAFTLGRFIQPDEFTGGPVDAFSANDPLPPGPLPYADITNPQSLNKYTYVYNNPLIFTDPNGHSVWTKIGKVILAGGDIAGTVAAVKEDVETMLDSNASTMDRVEAFGRAGSEFLPLSVSDAEDLGSLAGTGLAALGGANSSGAGPVQPYEVGTTGRAEEPVSTG